MHPSARRNFGAFVDAYLAHGRGVVLDVGAQDVNGTLRHALPGGYRYIGADAAPGAGVDIVLADPYVLPFESGSLDVVISSSCLEHCEFFWLLFLEIMRVLKPDGLCYLNVPSNGYFHRFPVDCWRFYPDAGAALERWGRRNGYPCALLESFVTPKDEDVWADFVAVFLRDEASLDMRTGRIIDGLETYTNGRVHGETALRRESHPTGDMVELNEMRAEIARRDGATR